jgi:hypothetical protein
MPGAYTHITMATEAGERRSLQHVAGFPRTAVAACGRYDRFVELGSVSPDYPYLDLMSGSAKQWADTMHYDRTGDMIKAITRRVRQMEGEQQRKCLAWLLGYASHVTMDVTIHPVINLRVGPYEANKTQHRICEMNQDVHIFRTRMNLNVTLAEHFDQGLNQCTGSDGGLDADIRALWLEALAEVHPDLFRENRPDPDSWHRWFRRGVDGIAENNFLAAISRHVAPGLGLNYQQNVEPSYVENLAVPNGGAMHFDEIFEAAKANVQRIWLAVAKGALGQGDDFETVLGQWDLDTGQDAATKRFVFWDA